MTTIELRRLALGDLLAIEEIERRSYPTPWSRSMFAGELAKPSSICLGAFEAEGENGALVGYLIVSRYVDAWHVMNVAVDPEHRGRGVATMLLERLFDLTADDGGRGYTLEVRVSNEHGDLPLRAARLPLARPAARLLHGQPGGRVDHVEGPGSALILGIETSCDETAAALVTEDGRDPLERRLVAGRAARALRRSRARGCVAATPRARQPGDPRGARGGGRDPRRRRPGRRHAGPGADRRAPRRPRRGEGGRLVAAPAARPRRPSRRPRRLALSPAGAARTAVPLSAGERRPHDAARRPLAQPNGSCSGRRSTTPRARRSTRAHACSGSATRAAARSTGSRAAATRVPTTSPSRACPASTSRSRG